MSHPKPSNLTKQTKIKNRNMLIPCSVHGNAMRALALIDPDLRAEYFRRVTLLSERDVEVATQVLAGDRLEGGSGDGEPVLLAELGKARGKKTVARCDLVSNSRALFVYHQVPRSLLRA